MTAQEWDLLTWLLALAAGITAIGVGIVWFKKFPD